MRDLLQSADMIEGEQADTHHDGQPNLEEGGSLLSVIDELCCRNVGQGMPAE
jgi:hypothetical protein